MQAIFLTKLARRKESCIDSQLLGYTVTAIIEATTKPKVVASLMVLVLILAKEPFLDYFAGSSVFHYALKQTCLNEECTERCKACYSETIA